MLDWVPSAPYTAEQLLEVLRILRDPENGCPWDKVQTHASIRKNFLEETCEVLEAIDADDPAMLREELGDVLMQVVFHADIEKDAGRFTMDDVCDGVVKKLLFRHPHVFGEVTVDGTGQVLRNWDAIKRQTKGGKTQAELLGGVPRSLPALMRAAKVQNRAKRVGFDWSEISGALDALESETAEFKEALASENPAAVEEELGDLLFSAVNVSRFLHIDAEQALTASTDKFIRRFARVEELAKSREIDLAAASLEEMDALWDEAKRLDPREESTPLGYKK